MSTAALVLLSVAGVAFVVRLLRGPSLADRVVALDGLLVVVVCGVLAAAARADRAVTLDTVLVVALVSFVGTGVLARFIERRGT